MCHGLTCQHTQLLQPRSLLHTPHGPSTCVVLSSLPIGLGGLNATGKVSLDVTRVLVSSIGYV